MSSPIDYYSPEIIVAVRPGPVGASGFTPRTTHANDIAVISALIGHSGQKSAVLRDHRLTVNDLEVAR